MLFPHRPELSKGIYEVLQVAQKLVREYGWSELRVLAPRWLDAESDTGIRQYYSNLRSAIAAAGLAENFIFHDWISEALIAEYYSLADVTMCIGSCVETFGNTPFESLGCGTPAICHGWRPIAISCRTNMSSASTSLILMRRPRAHM